MRFLYARKNEPGTGILGSSRNLGVFAQRREKDHSRVTAAKHVAKRNRFAPMFCDGKTGSNPASGPLSQNLRLLQHERSGRRSMRTLSACTEGAWQLSVNHKRILPPPPASAPRKNSPLVNLCRGSTRQRLPATDDITSSARSSD